MRFAIALGLLLAAVPAVASAQCVGGRCYAPPVVSSAPAYPQQIQGYRMVPQQYQLQSIQYQPRHPYWFPGRGIGRFIVGGWRNLGAGPRYYPAPVYTPVQPQGQ